MGETIEENIFVLFGATGDLAARKIIPALHQLHEKGALAESFRVIGTGRSEYTTETYREQVVGEAATHADDSFLRRFQYLQGDVTKDAFYDELRDLVDSVADQHGVNPEKVVFYYSLPPRFYGEVTERLRDVGLTSTNPNEAYPRVAFEKPFGTDLESAKELNDDIARGFSENHIFRIDHYLAKSAINNLLTFRFSNTIIESFFDRKQVDHVQFTLAESIGVGDRASYYDSSGALRDMVQSHALQTLALLLMDPPVSKQAKHIHAEKAKVLSSMYVDREDGEFNAVPGQYGAGTAEGEEVQAYTEEPDIPDDSTTETYAAAKLKMDNWRWSDTPIYVRTGKRLPRKLGEIRIVFNHPPCAMFCQPNDHIADNELCIRIQPDEQISLSFNTDGPEGSGIQTAWMNFAQYKQFDQTTPSAYEKIIRELLEGDKTRFAHWDEVRESWRIVQPVLDAWNDGVEPETYEAGTWGPSAAETLIEREGREWRA